MPTTVEQLSPTRVKITVEVPFSDLKPNLDKAYREIAQQINIPGFRKGKVPPPVIDQRFGRGVVLQEAINDALPELYGKAVDENDLKPMGQPEVDITKLEDGELVEFTAEVDVRPEVTLPDLSKISVEVPAVEVSDSDLEEQLDVLRQRFATLNDVDRAAADGDVVTIDLKATKDGEDLDEAQAEGLTYRVGAGGMLDGLDEALTGLSAGESNDFTSTLVGGPDMGTEADIHVTVTKVQEQELPELDDEFAQMVSEFDTVEEMTADLRAGLERNGRLEQAARARDLVLEKILEEAPIDLPEKLLAEEIETRNSQIDQQLQAAGTTLAKYLEASDEEAETEEEFRADVAKRATQALQAQILLDHVADAEEVGVEQEDLTAHIFRKAQQSGTTPEQEMQHMMEHNHLPEWMGEIRRGKALAWVVEQATVTDSDGNEVDLANLRGDGSIADPAAEEAAEAEEEASDEE
ncbi:trigger factor [Enemella sp. A6]|uniref:trigger factor n=1 Tax=Enemella sp. A6 TaxID=3440152 RepID=UPI003EB7A9A1